MFLVKTSKIEGAGYGIFAARPFSAGDILGVFYGKVSPSIPDDKHRRYAMEVAWPPIARPTAKKNKRIEQVHYLVDPEIGPTSREKEQRPCYFGLHMANDPSGTLTQKKTRSMVTRGSTTSNFIIDEFLVAHCTKDLSLGDELYLTYNGDAV
jgi:hypothetical protein